MQTIKTDSVLKKAFQEDYHAGCRHGDKNNSDSLPTCGVDSNFHYIGEQKWSEAVAEKLGIPTIVNLYNCDHCHTTLTDIQLKPKSS